MTEHGPFNTEREALATRSAALIRAAYDDHPGYGASVPESLKVMTDACEAYGVALGKLDLSFLQGVAWRETADTVSFAGIIARAYEAGKAAALDGAETKWAVRIGRSPDLNVYDEGSAKRVTAMLRENGIPAELYRREVTPWTPVPGEGNDDA